MSSLRTPDELASEVSSQLQKIEDGLVEGQQVSIKPPFGIIRRVKEDLLPEYDFVADPTVKRNICYAVEALDFYRWIINRFEVYGPVEGYLYKTGFILVNMIVEAMTQDFLKQKQEKPGKKHPKNIEKLKRLGVSEELCAKMCILHSRRANIHLHLVSELESKKYTLEDWNRSIVCLQKARGEFRGILTGGS